MNENFKISGFSSTTELNRTIQHYFFFSLPRNQNKTEYIIQIIISIYLLFTHFLGSQKEIKLENFTLIADIGNIDEDFLLLRLGQAGFFKGFGIFCWWVIFGWEKSELESRWSRSWRRNGSWRSAWLGGGRREKSPSAEGDVSQQSSSHGFF